MTVALSYLTNVTELGLSIDSGLGYFSGADISDRAQIFKGKTEVFGTRYTEPDTETRERIQTWKTVAKTLSNKVKQLKIELLANDQDNLNRFESLRASWRDAIAENPAIAAELSIGLSSWASQYLEQNGPSPRRLAPLPRWVRDLFPAFDDFYEESGLDGEFEAGTVGDCASSTHMQPDLLEMFSTADDELSAPLLIFQGIDLDQSVKQDTSFGTAPFLPASLTSAQREWLLETEWAQQAFLSSYILAVTDNSVTFQNVRTFTIAKLSSRYLPILDRNDVWGALPNLESLTILISADWRDVVKLHEGYVATPPVQPSSAAFHFLKLLNNQIAHKESIKSLTVGYIGGGEHATGLFARNRNVLPAPIGFIESTQPGEHFTMIDFPFLQDLTLTNLWFMPKVLTSFIERLSTQKLKAVHFNSVSLVAYGGIANPQVNAATQQPAAQPPAPAPAPAPPLSATNITLGIPHHLPVPLQLLHPPNMPQPLHAFQPQQVVQGQIAPVTHAHPLIMMPTVSNPPAAGYFPFVGPLPNIGVLQPPQPAPAAPPAAAPPVVAPTSSPTNFTWLTQDPAEDTWGHLINLITPGKTIERQRLDHDGNSWAIESASNAIKELCRIELTSCGYVKLPYQHFPPGTPFTIVSRPTHPKLSKRYSDLHSHMMHTLDGLNGQIIPVLKDFEQDVLVNAFQMRIGWGENPKKYENREDGQPDGGSGRFSGCLEKANGCDSYS